MREPFSTDLGTAFVTFVAVLGLGCAALTALVVLLS